MTRHLPILVFLAGASVTAQAPESSSLVRQLAQQTARLGMCHVELGQLQQAFVAPALTGDIVSVKQVVERFEAANPGQTVDPLTWKVGPNAPDSAVGK